MLESIFLNILHMGFTASVVILAVFAIRFLLRNQPRIFSYVLWIAVLFRLLCPVSFSSIYSVFSVLQEKAFNQPVIEYISTGQFNMKKNQPVALPMDNLSGKNTISEEINFSVNITGIILNCAKWIWLAGTVIVFSCGIIKMLKLYIKLKGAIRKEKNIYITNKTDIPFVMGIIKPVIYLPAFLEEKEMEYIILHEQTHIRRKDYLSRFLAFTALCIHWFNPFVWLAFFYSGEDMEMSCDETVIRKMGGNIKKEYSFSLLNLAAGKRLPGFFIQFGEGDTKKRVKNILRYKNRTLSAIIVTLLLVSGVIFVLISNPEKTKVKEVQTTELDKNTKIKNTGQETKITGKTEDTGQGTKIQQKDDKQKTFKEILQGGIIYVNIRDIARSARAIDLFVLAEDNNDWEKQAEEMSLAFADNCVYKINYEMDKIKYTKTDFDTFASLVNKEYYGNKYCKLFFENGLIVEADLLNGNYYNGISYREKTPDQIWYEKVVEEELYKSYIKTGQTEADVAETEGMETIEIYTDLQGSNAETGMILVKSSQGEILYSEKTDVTASGLARESINTGTINGNDFLMRVYMEDRDIYGEYVYEVFRLDAQGGILQIAGSEFEFDTEYNSFPKKAFKEWTQKMDYYFKDTKLLIGRQNGGIITKWSREEKDKYHYNILEKRFK